MAKKLDVMKSKMYRKNFYDFGNSYVQVSTEKVFIPIQFPNGDLDYVENVTVSDQKYKRIVNKVRNFDKRLQNSRRLH